MLFIVYPMLLLLYIRIPFTYTWILSLTEDTAPYSKRLAIECSRRCQNSKFVVYKRSKCVGTGKNAHTPPYTPPPPHTHAHKVRNKVNLGWKSDQCPGACQHSADSQWWTRQQSTLFFWRVQCKWGLIVFFVFSYFDSVLFPLWYWFISINFGTLVFMFDVNLRIWFNVFFVWVTITKRGRMLMRNWCLCLLLRR